MRMRKKKNLGPRLARCAPVLVSGPQAYRGRWRELFGSGAPLRLEIGCGKGRFALETARREPGVNLVAVEREEGALVMAAEKAMEAQLPNLRFLSFDAAQLGDVFAPGEVDLIYLNFSDPWPPNRQRKRRLTWRAFLAVYDSILSEDGALFFKTDNQRLFEWSLGEICQYGWLLQNISLDLHQSGLDNVMTEYEEKFSAQGSRIYRLEARRRLEKNLLK
ncbi:MAG: tRNA (guanosine(46)-N7)-methyltransferase TrmB [Clostridiaceae bacterium]|nr:tRNA (guanosine(46)-N7)-methyltransferase TrmB [Clostridiaceae bacterium]